MNWLILTFFLFSRSECIGGGGGGIGADPCMACCCAARLVPTVPLFTVRIRMFGNEEGQCRSLARISCCQTRVETTFFCENFVEFSFWLTAKFRILGNTK